MRIRQLSSYHQKIEDSFCRTAQGTANSGLDDCDDNQKMIILSSNHHKIEDTFCRTAQGEANSGMERGTQNQRQGKAVGGIGSGDDDYDNGGHDHHGS